MTERLSLEIHVDGIHDLIIDVAVSSDYDLEMVPLVVPVIGETIVEILIGIKFLQYQSHLDLCESMISDLPSVKNIYLPLNFF